jgi:Flp pilus assembly protein TadB
MIKKKRENKLKEGVIGAAIGATAVGAAVLLSDKKKRKQAVSAAKDVSNRLKIQSDGLRGRVAQVRGKLEELTQDEKDEVKSKARSATKRVQARKRQEES